MVALFDPEPSVESQRADWRSNVFNGYAHSTARANQFLATDWGALSTIDVCAIRDIINERLCKPLNRVSAEALMLVLGVLTTGRQVDEWLSYRLCPGELEDSIDIKLERHTPSWLWVMPAHNLYLGDGSGQAGFLIEPCPDIKLPCVPQMLRVFASCMEARFGSRKLPSKRIPLFSAPESMLRSEAAALLRKRANARSSTVTLQSVERWFWTASARVPGGDLASSCRISGRREDVVRAQLYYGVLRRSRALQLTIKTLSSAGFIGNVDCAIPIDGYVGATRTPTIGMMSDLAKNSSHEVKRARRTNDAIKIHNAMTLHTVSVIMLATGLRPNKDACLRFYPEHGFALIFDKRVEDPRVRPIPLAQLVCTQILLYRAHLAALSITPEIALTQAFRHKARRGKLPFFLLASDGTTSLRGIVSCWQRALKGNFGRDLPANLQRHFLRAELVGKASTETIDAFFGHWIVGTEPWGRYSALDPMVYRTDIGPAVDRALQQMGWREERGLGNGKASGVIGAKIEIGESLVDRPIKLGKKLRSEPSPFNNLLVQTLHSKLTRVTPDPLAPAGPLYAAQLGQILASAITNGALLDKNWFKPFLEALPNVPIRKERLWIDMEPADPGDTKHVYAYPRRWFCDPITEILIRRWRAVERQSGRITVQHSPEECLAAHLAGGSAEKKGHILDRFLEEAQVRWRFRMPGILVSYAVGEGPSLSLPGTTWERATYGRRIRAEKPPKPEWGKPERSKYTFFGERTPRSSALIKALKSDAAFSSFLQGYKGDGSLFAHVVRWAELAVHVKGGRRAGLRSWGQKARYKISTICTYADNVCKVLDDYSHAPMESLNADDLDNIYWCQLHTLSQESNPNTAINAINSFHSYLLDIFPEFYIGDNYDEFRTEGRVSLNMISSADYVRALDQLPGEGRKARILRLVLILGFRTGLRLPEILGLRHSDIAEAVDSLSDRKLMELYLRPYDTFTLKTSHSRRMLPLDGLLPPQELEELRRWQTDHYEEARDRPNGLLFTSAGGGQGKAHAATVRKQIIEALVRATGDEGMRFEHLRHSFATQLLACLLLPREGSVLPLPRGLDADSISGQRRDQIIARISGHERPGRSALHIVSQLCGHGPVTTTLRWYTHMLDWSVGAFTNRRNIEPQIPASSVLGTVNMLGEIHTLEAVKRADYRYRLNYPLVEPSSATSSEYQLPSAQEKVRPTNGHVNLMSAFPLLLRKFGSPSQKPALTGDAKLLRKLRPLPYTKLPDTSPGWTNVHTAVMGLRNGIDLVALSEGLGVSPEKIRRWLYMADLLAGPRRQGEKHMRFEPKMAAKARERFNVDAWKQAFPRMPSDTSSRDLVDQIWSKACLVMEDPDVPWALREFCRYYSVDTGYTSLLKKKDALRFYRGMALMGFANDLSVWPLWKKQRQILKGVPRECEQLRWRLAGGLAKGLRPKAPKVPEPATGRFPRSVAIQIGVPAFPGASETFKTNNHFRYAVRFALTMLAIANLDDIIEPKLRGGWRPGYGGYF